jgi:large subunit ribosomal protein L4
MATATNLSVDIVDSNKKSVGKTDLPAGIFGAIVKKQLLWEVVRQQQASTRAGTHSTKKRGDISGGGKKPYKQKHTGQARHGSTREPQWRHGGNVWGPLPRDYGYDVPKKVAKGAIISALSLRQKEGKVVVLDKLELAKPSTKAAAKMLASLGLSKNTLVITGGRDANVEKSFRNLEKVKVLPVDGLNVRDVLRYANLLILKNALEGISKRVAA